jgi:aprataxin
MTTLDATSSSGAGRPDLFQLRKWASLRHPEHLPPTVLVDTTERTIAIIDKYPKAMFHVLVLPRPQDGVSAEDMDSLRTLVAKVGKERAKEVLEEIGAHARRVRDDIQLQMKQRYKFQWDVWIGFHAVPSMQ